MRVNGDREARESSLADVSESAASRRLVNSRQTSSQFLQPNGTRCNLIFHRYTGSFLSGNFRQFFVSSILSFEFFFA